jgi:hypothetical protein
MTSHRIIPLVIAGVLLGATPALARDHGPAITIGTFFGLPVPMPPVVVVRPPAGREVVVVEREGRHRHEHGRHEQGWRKEKCGEDDRRRERVHREHDHRHSRRDLHRGERVVVVKRGGERWHD